MPEIPFLQRNYDDVGMRWGWLAGLAGGFAGTLALAASFPVGTGLFKVLVSAGEFPFIIFGGILTGLVTSAAGDLIGSWIPRPRILEQSLNAKLLDWKVEADDQHVVASRLTALLGPGKGISEIIVYNRQQGIGEYIRETTEVASPQCSPVNPNQAYRDLRSLEVRATPLWHTIGEVRRAADIIDDEAFRPYAKMARRIGITLTKPSSGASKMEMVQRPVQTPGTMLKP